MIVLLGKGGQTIQDCGYWPTYHDYMTVLLGEGAWGRLSKMAAIVLPDYMIVLLGEGGQKIQDESVGVHILLGEGGETIQDGGYWPTYHDYMIVLLGEGGQTNQDGGY